MTAGGSTVEPDFKVGDLVKSIDPIFADVEGKVTRTMGKTVEVRLENGSWVILGQEKLTLVRAAAGDASA